jgi:hypothetical protein
LVAISIGWNVENEHRPVVFSSKQPISNPELTEYFIKFARKR